MKCICHPASLILTGFHQPDCPEYPPRGYNTAPRTPDPAPAAARDAGGEEFTRNDCPDCKGENLECGICGGIPRGEPGAIKVNQATPPPATEALPVAPMGGFFTPPPVAPVAREETATPETDAFVKANGPRTGTRLPVFQDFADFASSIECRLRAAEAERDNRPPQAEYEQLCASNSVYEKEVAQLRAEVARLTGELEEAKENANAMRHDVYKAEGICVKLNAALATTTARKTALGLLAKRDAARSERDELRGRLGL